MRISKETSSGDRKPRLEGVVRDTGGGGAMREGAESSEIGVRVGEGSWVENVLFQGLWESVRCPINPGHTVP